MKKYIAEKITADPKIRFGKPTIEGTRVPIEVIVGKIAGGMTFEEVMQEYDLTRKQIQAALKYAAELVSQEKFVLA